MTRVLIVDDDPNQLKLLARVISARRPGLSVLTASSGVDAIEKLQASAIDLVLTDLQMPETNGFGLVTWLLSHQPHVQVFTMTAYPDDDAVDRLRALGSVECYTKPLDITKVMERLAVTLKHGMRGHVRNISLPSLLQLIAMERKTCTLTVEADDRTGYIYVQDGVIIDARVDDQRGDEAAIEVTGWPSPAVTIINTCATKQRTVAQSVSFIIMEAVRLTDEAERNRSAEAQRAPGGNSDADELDLGPFAAEGVSDAAISLRSVSHYPLRKPGDADAIAIVECESGRIRTSAGEFPALEELAQLVARIYYHEAATIESLHTDDVMQELVMTTARYWTMTRPLPTTPPSLAMVVFDPGRANLVLERIELEAFVTALEAWSSAQA